MHLIRRRGTRRALVLLLAMSGLLAVPALALAHSDLSLVKVVDHAQAAPGDLLTYTILIENHGTHANAPGTMTDTLPAHTTFVSASAGCTAAAGVITCPVAPLAVGATVSYTVTVRVDDDVPAGDLVNIADVAAPGDRPTTNNHGEATSTVGLRGPRRLRLVGSEPRRAAERRRARLRRRDGAPLQRRRSARRDDYDRRQRPLPLRQAAARDDVLGLPRRARRQRGRRPARRLRADGCRRRRRRRRRLRRRPAQRRALHRGRRHRRRRLVHPDLRLRLLEAGRHRRPGLGGLRTTTASRMRASMASAAWESRSTTPRAPRSRTP